MAKGTMISAAEYYNDTEKYTGDIGTNTNPYIIEDVYDFCAMNNGYYVMVNDIDFNDHSTYRAGITVRVINGEHMNINGKGHSIYNLVFKQSEHNFIKCSGSTIFNNVNFVNMCLISRTYNLFSTTFGSYSNYVQFTFNNCNFAIYSANGGLSAMAETNFNNCTINLYGTYTNLQLNYAVNQITIQNTQINFNDIKLLVSGDTEVLHGRSGRDVIIKFCYFTGKITLFNRVLHDTSFTIQWWKSCTLHNSYMCVNVKTDCDSSLTLFNNISIGSAQSCSFMDKDVMNNFTSGTYNNFYALTTEQCQNPAYLTSLGFPILEIKDEEQTTDPTPAPAETNAETQV